MKVPLKVVMLSHINDMRIEMGFINGKTNEEAFEKINKRLDFLSSLTLKHIDGQKYIDPDVEFAKLDK